MKISRTAKRLGALVLGVAIAGGAAACTAPSAASETTPATGSAGSETVDTSGVTLKVGVLDNVWAKLITESGLFDDAEYKLDVSIATFPQQVAGLNSGQFDLAFYGVTTSVNQAGNDPVSWTADSAPVKLIGGWAPDQVGDYPWFGTAVRTDSGISSLDDLKGSTWAYSTSGDAYPSFLANLKAADLTRDDVTALKFDTTPEQVAAFASGQADVFTGSFTSIAPLITSGDATILTTSRELGVPVLRGYAVKTSTLDDAVKVAAIGDWFVRFNELNTTYWDEHEEEIVKLYEDELKLTPEAAEYSWKSLEGVKPRTFDKALLAGVQQNADLFYEDGAISNPVDDVSVFFDDRFNQTVETTPLF